MTTDRAPELRSRGKKTITELELLEIEKLTSQIALKASSFLRGVYEPPTPQELTAVRLTLGMSQIEMASFLGCSTRLWNEYERKTTAKMRRPYFALLLIFALPATAAWHDILATLHTMGAPRGRDKNS